MFEEKIWQIGQKTDIIILPEMFTTGFTMEAKDLAEHLNMTTFKWMRQIAEQTGAVVMGSYIVQDSGHYFNRLLWMQPDGEFAYYDKRHLFRMANEQETYTAGFTKIIQTWKGWRIMPLICYDLRFPVWSRNVNFAYDALIYIANWPQVRIGAWKTLLKARAVENLAYCIGVNRVGTDGKGLEYSGDSAVIDFKGNTLFEEANKELIQTISLNKAELSDFRQKFPADLDADTFEITNI
jgi:predicted amidohydrolase